MGIDLGNVEPWDLVAEGYSEVTMKLFQDYANSALEMVKISNQSHILDLACGPGTLALSAAKKAARVTALDFSREMIGILNRTLERDGISNVETYCGDGQALPYDNNFFDATFSMFGLMFFPDRMKGYKEIHRTLMPGGEAVISSWAPLSDSPAMAAVFGAIRAMNPGMPEPQKKVETLEDPVFFKKEMTKAGFRNVEVQPVTSSLEIDTIESYWEDMIKGSAPLVMMKKGMPEELWQKKNKIALAYLHETLGSIKTLSARAWLAYGVK